MRGTAWLLRNLVLVVAFASPLAAQDLSPGQSQSPGPGQNQSPILTLDQDRFYAGSLFGKALEAKSVAEVQVLAAENRKIEAELAAEELALTEKRARLKPEEFRPLADAFDAKVERIRAEQDAKSRALVQAHDAGRKHFFEVAVPILGEMMRRMGAVAILNKGAVILSFDVIDMTDAAIAELDKTLGDGSALPPETPAPATDEAAPAP